MEKTMTDQEKKEEATNITSQPNAENKKTELSEEELKKISGGGIYMNLGNDIQQPVTHERFESWIE
jgi:bacteriocin-like protein